MKDDSLKEISEEKKLLIWESEGPDAERGDTPEAERGCSAAVRAMLSRPCVAAYLRELTELFSISWPIVLTSLQQQLILMISIIFCGHLGKQQLDAAALASTIINVTGCSVCIGLVNAFDTLLTQAYGSACKKSVGTILQRGIWILLLACLPCWAVIINTGNIIRLFGQSPSMAQLGQTYAEMYMLGLPAFAVYFCLSRYLQAQSIVYPSLIIGMVVNLLNATFHAVFLFVLKWDVRGAGIAVSLTYWLQVAFHLLYIRVSRCYVDTWPGLQMVESLKKWWSFLKLAIPGMLMVCLEWWSFEVMVVVAGLLGETPLAAHSIMYQIVESYYMIPIGLSISGSVRVGNHLGEGKPEEAKMAARVLIALMWTMSIVIASFILGLRNIFPYVFTEDAEIASLVTSLVPILALFCLGDSTQGSAGGILRGIGLQKFGAVINIIAFYFIGIPVALPLMLRTPLGIAGAWWGILASTVFQSFCFLIRIGCTDWQEESKKAIARTEEQSTAKSLGKDSAIEYTPLDDVDNEGDATPAPDKPSCPAYSLTILLVTKAAALLAMVLVFLAGVLTDHFLSAYLSSLDTSNGTTCNSSLTVVV